MFTNTNCFEGYIVTRDVTNVAGMYSVVSSALSGQLVELT